jgi:anthranilate phosphoribosyltransferase
MTTEETYALQQKILRGELSVEALLDVFASFDRPLTTDEFYGLYKASAEAMTGVEATLPAVDTCGTGGDGLNTFNISTASALLVAALGVPVAKHGNRSASGACGSADVLEALGFKIDMNAEQAALCLQATNFCFMFAPTFHTAFKNASVARKLFGKRTYFNFLGPLLNPASAPYRLVGVSEQSMVDVIGTTLMRAGVQKMWVVHSADGMDEISPIATTTVAEYVPEQAVRTFSIGPSSHACAQASLADLAGGNAVHNAAIIRSILGGQGTPAQTDAVVLNAAGALVIAARVTTYTEGVVLARAGIVERAGMEKLQQLVAFTKDLAPLPG